MTGNWHEITEPEAAQIAIWMAMTTAVIAMSFKNSSTPFADRQHIASTLTVPAHWQIWIGRGSGFGEMYYSNRVCQLQTGSERAVKAGEINTGVTTVALGQLLLHCINVPIPELMPDPVLYGWMQGLLPIHPWGGDTLEISTLPFIRDKSPEYDRLVDGYFSEILMPLGRR